MINFSVRAAPPASPGEGDLRAARGCNRAVAQGQAVGGGNLACEFNGLFALPTTRQAISFRPSTSRTTTMLRDKLNEALKEAMRARDQGVVGAIRLILAKLKEVDIAART